MLPFKCLPSCVFNYNQQVQERLVLSPTPWLEAEGTLSARFPSRFRFSWSWYGASESQCSLSIALLCVLPEMKSHFTNEGESHLQ